MALTAADALIETHQDWGVEVVFGLPGDGINGIMEACASGATIDFALFARACGATGFTIDNPADCGRMIEEALATPGPVVVQGVVDPFEPPLPAKVTLDQAAKFAKSLLRGEPNSQKIALTVLGERIRELV